MAAEKGRRLGKIQCGGLVRPPKPTVLLGVGTNPQIGDFGHLLGDKKIGWGHVLNGLKLGGFWKI